MQSSPPSSRAPFILVLLLAVLVVLASNAFFIVRQTETALVTQFGNPVAKVLEPGLKFKIPFIQNVERFDNRLLEYVMPEEIEINASDEKRIRLEAFLRWRIVDPLAFARATRTAGIGGNRISTMNLQLSNLLGSSLRQVIGTVPLNALLSPERDRVMQQIREIVTKQATSSPGDPVESEADLKVKSPLGSTTGFGIEIVDVRIVKADLPPENSNAVFKRMQTEREREAKGYRAKGDQDAQVIRANADRERTVLLADAQRKAEILRGEGDAEAARISAEAYNKDAEFYNFYRSMQAYSKALNAKDTSVVMSPDSEFLKEFGTKKQGK